MPKKQLLSLGIGGFIISLFRAARAIISTLLIDNSSNYVGAQNMYYVALDNVTELYMWYKLIFNLMPTLLLFYVIYYIPKRAGKINKDLVLDQGQDVTIQDIDIRKEIEGEDSNNGDFNFLHNPKMKKESDKIKAGYTGVDLHEESSIAGKCH